MFTKPIFSDFKTAAWKESSTSRAQSTLWLAFLEYLDEKIFFPYRYQQLTEMLSPHLKEVGTVLDVGSSCGRLARRLADKTRCSIVGVDVCLQPNAYIDVHHYDGQHLPFHDSTFECVMMVDMLHHVDHIEQVLSEARRVSRRYLLIKDHYWENRFDLLGLRVSDYIGNAPYGVPLPYNYLRLEAWQTTFERLNLTVASCQTWKYHPLDPCDHVVFILQKPEMMV